MNSTFSSNQKSQLTTPGITVLRCAVSVVIVCTLALVHDNAVAQDEEVIEEIVTIGTRAPGRVSADLAVAVDTLSADEMAATGQTEVGRMLQSLAPSFNFSSSSISDGTDALRPATLRGLGPDQTLVLVNGKRRHQASLIHINNSVGRGTAGTDMNAFPAAAIYLAPDLAEKLPKLPTGVRLGEDPPEAWADEIDQTWLRPGPYSGL